MKKYVLTDTHDGCLYTEEVTCPYCGYTWQYDTADGLPDDEYCECDECGREYLVNKDIEITYITLRLAIIRITKDIYNLKAGEILYTTTGRYGTTEPKWINDKWENIRIFRCNDCSIPIEHAEWLGYEEIEGDEE